MAAVVDKMALAMGTQPAVEQPKPNEVPPPAPPPPPPAPPPPVDVLDFGPPPAPLGLIPQNPQPGFTEADARAFIRQAIASDAEHGDGARQIADYLRRHRNDLSFISLRAMGLELENAVYDGAISRERAEQLRAPITAVYSEAVEGWRRYVTGT